MMLVLGVITALVVVALVDGKKSDASLPSCDSTRDNYKAGKLYDVLGIKKSATKKDVRRAFKKMSVKCHPDKDRENENADDNFIAITGAYETLSDEDERRKFDAGPSPFDQQQGPGSSGRHYHSGFPGGYQQGGPQYQQWKPKDFKDIKVDDVLRSFFGGSRKDSSSSRGQFNFNFGSGGGDDQEFESLFKNFNFGSHGSSGRKKSASSKKGADFTSGFGSILNDLSSLSGMFEGFGDIGSRSSFSSLPQGSSKRHSRLPSSTSSQNKKKPTSSTKSKSKSTSSKKPRTPLTPKMKKTTSRPQPPPPPPPSRNTQSSKVRDALREKLNRRRRKSSGSASNCRYSVKDGEVCDQSKTFPFKR